MPIVWLEADWLGTNQTPKSQTAHHYAHAHSYDMWCSEYRLLGCVVREYQTAIPRPLSRLYESSPYSWGNLSFASQDYLAVGGFDGINLP